MDLTRENRAEMGELFGHEGIEDTQGTSHERDARGFRCLISYLSLLRTLKWSGFDNLGFRSHFISES
jgi:hypothetical protein